MLYLNPVIRFVIVFVGALLCSVLILYSLRSYHAHHLLTQAKALLERGKFDLAVEKLTYAQSLTPGDAALASQLGLSNLYLLVFRQDADYAKRMLEAYQQAYQLNPLKAAYFRDTALAYSRLGNLDEAEVYYSRALGRDPNNRELLISKADVLALQAKVEPALDLYQKAYRIRPSADLAQIIGQLTPGE